MDKPTFPDIDGLLGSIRHVATPVGQHTVSDEPDGTTTRPKENIPDNEYRPHKTAGKVDYGHKL